MLTRLLPKSPEPQSVRSTEHSAPQQEKTETSSKPSARKLDANGFAKPAGFDELPSSQRSTSRKRKGGDSAPTAPESTAHVSDDDEMLLGGARAKKAKKRKNKRQDRKVAEATADHAASDDEADRFMEEMIAELRDD